MHDKCDVCQCRHHPISRIIYVGKLNAILACSANCADRFEKNQLAYAMAECSRTQRDAGEAQAILDNIKNMRVEAC